MYRQNTAKQTTLKVNKAYEGETIEQKVNRILNNKEPIKDGAPRIYTERRQGVLPEMNIRTDRFEIAVEAMDKIQQANIARRAENVKAFEEKLNKANDKIQDNKAQNNAGGEPIGGTTPAPGV